ncbi:MAG: alpha/beta fold hydrolase [Betaproteobacteria bacterium]
MRGYTALALGVACLLALVGHNPAGAQHAIAVDCRQVKVSGLSLHYERYAPVGEAALYGGPAGAALAPPVLLLHGLGASTAVWLKTAPELARAGFTVYALDFPGFGGSEVPQTKISVLDLPGYVAAFLRELGVGRVSVVGNSMGGYVAWLLAADHPELVDKLVLIDAAGLPLPDPLPETIQRLRPWYLGLPGAEFIGENVEKVLNGPEMRGLSQEISRPYIEQVFADPTRLTPEIFEALHRSFLASRSVFLGRLDFPLPAPDFARRLSGVAAPTLVVWGGRDALLPASDGGRFAALIPRAQLVVYPELGHVPMLEDPQAFLTDLLRFLQ